MNSHKELTNIAETDQNVIEINDEDTNTQDINSNDDTSGNLIDKDHQPDALSINMDNANNTTSQVKVTNNDLTYGEAAQLIAYNFLPSSLGRLINILNGPVTTFIMSRYNANLIAVMPLVSAGQLLTATIPSMVFSGGASLIGKENGAAQIDNARYKNIGSIVQGGMIASLALSVPTILMMNFSRSILSSIGQDPDLSTEAQAYFRAYSLGVPALFGTIAAQQLGSALKMPMLSFSTIALNTLISNGLGYLFVNGAVDGFGEGISGMGYSNALANWITLGTILGYYALNKDFRKFNIFSYHNVTSLMNSIKNIFISGTPIAIAVGAEISTLAGMSLLAGRYGKTYLAAHQIASQFFSFYMGISIGMSQAASPLISNEVGNKHYKNANTLAKTSLAVSFLSGLTLASLGYGLSRPLTSLFLSENISNVSSNLLALTKKLILIDAIAQPADYVRNCTTGLLRGYSMDWLPLFLNVLFMGSMTFGMSQVLDHTVEDNGDVSLYSGRAMGMYLAAFSLLVTLYKIGSNYLDASSEPAKPPTTPTASTNTTWYGRLFSKANFGISNEKTPLLSSNKKLVSTI